MCEQPHLQVFSAPPKEGVCICPWVEKKETNPKPNQQTQKNKRKEKERIKVLIIEHLVVPGGNESGVISEITDGDGTEVHFPAAH